MVLNTKFFEDKKWTQAIVGTSIMSSNPSQQKISTEYSVGISWYDTDEIPTDTNRNTNPGMQL